MENLVINSFEIPFFFKLHYAILELALQEEFVGVTLLFPFKLINIELASLGLNSSADGSDSLPDDSSRSPSWLVDF